MNIWKWLTAPGKKTSMLRDSNGKYVASVTEPGPSRLRRIISRIGDTKIKTPDRIPMFCAGCFLLIGPQSPVITQFCVAMILLDLAVEYRR